MTALPTDQELAHACLASYLPGSGAPDTGLIEIGLDLAALVIERQDRVVIAFRGTTNVPGWLRDFDALPVHHDKLGFCHSGFLRGAAALWNKLSLPTDRPVVLTGHSLGGALAVLVAALRVAAHDRIDGLVTFGAPRAGFHTVKDLLEHIPVRQYRRGLDPVTEVPFDLPVFPYRHAREPLIQIGQPAKEPWLNHSILGYGSDLESGEQGNG